MLDAGFQIDGERAARLKDNEHYARQAVCAAEHVAKTAGWTWDELVEFILDLAEDADK